MKNDQTTQPKHVLGLDMTGTDLVEMINNKVSESKSFWDSDFKLEHHTKENEELYLGNQVAKNEGEEEDLSLDNRIFSAIRTIVPYVTSRITEPEVYPSSRSESAKKFAEDFEKAIYIKADTEKVRDKAKFALEDAMIRRRGYLKPRYDAVTGNFCSIEYVPAESIVVDHKAKPYEEPRYFRHLLEKSVEDLITMFPEMEDTIKDTFKITDASKKSELQACHTINEDWLFVPDKKEGLDLLVCWSYEEMYLGGTRDPNWVYDGENFLEHHMMPLVFFNVLSDGRHLVDKTSYVEQAKFLQKNVDERGKQISKNVGIGSVGMPVVDASALSEEQAQYLTYEGDTVLALDVANSGKNSIRDVFDLWKATPLGRDVYEDKIDSRNSIDTAFGTPNVFRGEQSKNNTLGQDVLIRDQAFGRQQEIVDAIDNAMSRLYLLIAQFMLVYGGKPDPQDEDNEYETFEFMGEDGEFDYIMLSIPELDTKVKIRVKSGTSMPIDKAQRRATADKAAQYKMIDPLTYWEIMDEGNAQKYAKRLMDFMADPPSFLKDTEEDVFNRDAFVDIQKLKAGQEPQFRDDLPKEYFDYLNHYVLSGDLDNPQIPPETKQAISTFIDAQLARGQRMLGMQQTQLPTPDEVNAANQQTDQLNQQDQQAVTDAAKAQPKQQQLPVNQPAIA